MAVATGTALLIAGLGAAGGQLASGALASKAAGKSAQLQTESANKAADLQAQAARDQLDFAKAEAQRQRQIDETNRRANYEQWAARQRGLGTLASLIGLPMPEIPSYVPLEGGTSGTLASALPQPGTTRAGAAAVPGGDYQTWFQSLIAGKPFTQQTLLALEPTLNEHGLRLTPPNAVGDRTKIQLPDGTWVRVGFGEGRPVWVPQPGTGPGVGGPTMRPMPAASYGTLASALPYQPLVLTPPIDPSQQGTLAAAWRR